MPLQITEHKDGRLLEVQVTGKLHKADYEEFSPRVESLLARHGKISFLLVTHDFSGWDAGALWEDVKFDLKHFSDIRRLAVVGETKWEKGMTHFCRPFTTAEIRFFPPAHLAEAREWALEASAPS